MKLNPKELQRWKTTNLERVWVRESILQLEELGRCKMRTNLEERVYVCVWEKLRKWRKRKKRETKRDLREIERVLSVHVKKKKEAGILVLAIALRVVNWLGQASPTHFYLAYGHNGLLTS